MTRETRAVLETVLRWDQARILRLHRQGTGHDCSVYMGRQTRAGAALEQPIEGWDQDVRELFQQLLETHGEVAAGRVQRVDMIGFGSRRVLRTDVTPFAAVRAAAEEIGVIDALRLGGSVIWRS